MQKIESYTFQFCNHENAHPGCPSTESVHETGKFYIPCEKFFKDEILSRKIRLFGFDQKYGLNESGNVYHLHGYQGGVENLTENSSLDKMTVEKFSLNILNDRDRFVRRMKEISDLAVKSFGKQLSHYDFPIITRHKGWSDLEICFSFDFCCLCPECFRTCGNCGQDFKDNRALSMHLHKEHPDHLVSYVDFLRKIEDDVNCHDIQKKRPIPCDGDTGRNESGQDITENFLSVVSSSFKDRFGEKWTERKWPKEQIFGPESQNGGNRLCMINCKICSGPDCNSCKNCELNKKLRKKKSPEIKCRAKISNCERTFRIWEWRLFKSCKKREKLRVLRKSSPHPISDYFSQID